MDPRVINKPSSGGGVCGGGGGGGGGGASFAGRGVLGHPQLGNEFKTREPQKKKNPKACGLTDP